MTDSLLRSSIKAFLITFFVVMGFFLALTPIMLILNAIETNEETLPTQYTLEILPNADGIRKKMAKATPVILQIDINGMIGTPELNQKTIETLLVESREGTLKNDRVKAILLRINTPGGTVNDADGIYRALLSYKARYNTPIFAYVDGLCASGGMYVASAADQVFASDVSLVGSVGVITPPFMNVSKLLDKIGVDSLTISAGLGKDALDPFRPWKADEDTNLRDVINYYYQSFVDIVTKDRKGLSKEALVKTYGAKIFPAEQAHQFGYIDGVGASREETLKKLLTKLGFDGDYYQVVKLESSNWLTQLFLTKSPLLTGKVQHEIMGAGLPLELQNKPLYLYLP